MAIDIKLVTQLREMTGAGIMDARNILQEVDGDLDKAVEELRKRGIVKAANKANRETHEGLVRTYIHANGKLGSLVEVLCETDFVAHTEIFQTLCDDLALHVSACDPLYITREQVPQELIDKELEIIKAELASQNKPAEVIEKISEGKLNKYFSEIVLVEQSYIKDDSKTVGDFIKEKIAIIGENIQVSRISRFHIA